MAGKGILIDENNEPIIVEGSMVIGDTEMQEVALILGLNQGEHKFNPVLGPNLIQLSKTNQSKFDIEQRVRVHLAMDGKDYNAIKNKIQIST